MVLYTVHCISVYERFFQTFHALELVKVLNQAPKGLGNAALRVRVPGAKKARLEQHRTEQVDALEQVQVDVHVEGHLPPLLELLLLGGAVVPPHRHALRKQLPHRRF